MPLLSRKGGPLAELMALDTPLQVPKRKSARKGPPLTFGLRPPEPEVIPEDEWTTRDYIAAGTRGLGGLFGVTPLTGAAGGGLSEVAAQLIEGNNPLTTEGLTEIGAATALGATGGKLAKTALTAAGPLRAMLSAAPWAAAQPFISSGIREGELPSMEDVGWSTALGAGTAGATSGLLKALGVNLPPGGKPKAATQTFEIEQTPTLGKGVLAAGPRTKKIVGTGDAPAPGAVPLTDDLRPGAYPDAGGLSPRASKALAAAQKAAAPNLAELRHAAGAEDAAWKLLRKEADELGAREAIEDAIAAQGLQPMVPTVSEGVSAKLPGGKTQRMSTRFAAPEEEADEAVEAVAGFMGGGKASKARAPKAPKGAAPAAAVAQDVIPVAAQGPAAPLTATLGEMLGAKSVAPPIAAPLAGGLDELLGVAERRVGRDPQLDALYQAERQGVNPLGAVAPLSREAGAVDDVTAQLVDEPIELAERRAIPRTPEDEAYTQALRSGASPEDAEAIRAQTGFMRRASEERALAASRETGTPLPQVEAQVAAAAAPEAPPQLASLFRSPGQAAGQHYANLKQMFGAGESGLPTDVVKDVQRVAQNKVAGRAAGRLAKEEGLPPGTPPQAEVPQAPSAPARRGFMDRLRGEASGAPARTPMTPEDQASILQKIDAQKGRPGGPQANMLGPTSLRGRAGGESGFATPETLARIFLGGAGALVGGAADPLGDPIMSALAGTAVGAALPSLAAKAAQIGPLLENNTQISPDTKAWFSTLTTSEGMAQNVRDVVRAVPNLMRANMLTGPNLVNNAGVGPWASGVHFALEQIAKGDPDGWRILADMRPDKWMQRGWQHRQEAAQLVGEWERAGGQMLGEAGNAIEQVATIPGSIMTGGDLATRLPIAEKYGEKIARRATMTDEPEYAFSKKIVDLQRAGPLGQLLLPFARTLVNLGEEGIQRTPGLGSLAQSFRPNPDDMQTQLIKQMFGGGSAAGGYLAGQNMDALTSLSPMDDSQEARFLRNFFSNLAGPNAVLANAGMAAGMASDLGKTPTQQLGTGLVESMEDVPLPSWDPLTAWPKMLMAEPGNARVPSGVMPAFMRDWVNQGLLGAGERGNRPQAASQKQRQQRSER